MSVRIGFDRYTIADRGLSAEETLAFATTMGFDGVQFLDASEIDQDLNADRLVEFRQHAAQQGLYLELGIPSPNPLRHSQTEGRDVTAPELAHRLIEHLEAAAVLGCSHVRAYIGNRHDRFRKDVAWSTQSRAAVEVLRLIVPKLVEHGIRVALETHADVTVSELLAILEELGPECLGVTFDTGNILMRLDDPIAAAERLAPWVLATHVKDAVLAFTPRGLCWQSRPVGSGILPMPDLLAPLIHANPNLTLSIELHPRTYDLPIYDKTWLNHFPGLSAPDLAAVVRVAAMCESRYAEGSLLRPERVEKIPWQERDLDWLASSLGYLRTVVQGLLRAES